MKNTIRTLILVFTTVLTMSNALAEPNPNPIQSGLYAYGPGYPCIMTVDRLSTEPASPLYVQVRSLYNRNGLTCQREWQEEFACLGDSIGEYCQLENKSDGFLYRFTIRPTQKGLMLVNEYKDKKTGNWKFLNRQLLLSLPIETKLEDIKK